jgi:hypothetical protein
VTLGPPDEIRILAQAVGAVPTHDNDFQPRPSPQTLLALWSWRKPAGFTSRFVCRANGIELPQKRARW